MFFPNQTSYVNFPIILAYVKEVIQRKTVEGGGHEFGLTIEEISDEIRDIFTAQFGSCPISILDISNALNQIDQNGNLIFRSFINFEGQTLWSVSPEIAEKEPQKIYFERIKSHNLPKIKEESPIIVKKTKEKSNLLATIDFSLMLKDERELFEEVEKLKAKKLKIERENTNMRVKLRLLQDPTLLRDTIDDIYQYHNEISYTNEYLQSKVKEVIDEIDFALNLYND